MLNQTLLLHFEMGESIPVGILDINYYPDIPVTTCFFDEKEVSKLSLCPSIKTAQAIASTLKNKFSMVRVANNQLGRTASIGLRER